jgi:vibriolysin
MARKLYSKGYSLLVAFASLAAACVSGCADEGVGGDEGASEDVAKSVAEVIAALPDADVREVGRDGLPTFVAGDFGRLPAGAGARAAAPSLERIAPIFGLRPADARLVRATTDREGFRHFHYVQLIDGEDVVGSEFVVHADPKGLIYATHGNARRGAAVPASAVGRLGAPALGDDYAGAAVSAPELVYVQSSRDGKVYRAWRVVAEGERAGDPYKDRLFLDARSGKVVDVHPLIHSGLSRRVHNGNNTSSLPGTLARSEGQGANADATVNANYDLLGGVHACYQALFQRDSYDNAGATLISTVHHQRNYVNAFWNGSQMVYGDGDGVQATSLALSFDVTAHELTHAVTERESGLVYQNESGAINEALSDIFAAICEARLDGSVSGDTWKVGEDIWTPATAGDALRYMDNPTRDDYSKDYYPERITGPSDNGGVHGNSGIANHAFYLLTVGGQHVRGKTPGVTVPALGIDKAAQIWYRAQTTYLTSSSGYASLRTALRQAATDLYGADAAAATDKSMDAVGAPGGAPPPPPPPPTTTVLTNGTAVGGQGAAKNASLFYTIDLPTGATNIRVTTTGGTGDADLFGKLNSAPNGSADATWKSEGSSAAESITVPNGTAGKLYLQLFGYTAFSGVTIKAEYTTGNPPPPPPGDVLQNGVPVTGLSGAKDSKKVFTIDVPAGARNLQFKTSGGTGDADLYVRFNAAPTTSTYDFRSIGNSNNETVTAGTVNTGKYYVLISGYSAYSGLSITASYTN